MWRALNSPSRLVRSTSSDDENAAVAVVGREHPLVRLFTLRRALLGQIAVTSIPILLGIAGTVRHVTIAPVVLGAAGFVELMLAAAALFVRQQIRYCARELIASGNGALRVSVVIDERGRLLTRREREKLARSLERLLHDAQRWYSIFPASRPPQGVLCLRFAAEEVLDVVSQLRSDSASARGVALVARFLTDGTSSSLYRGDVELLREELHLIREALTPPRPSLDTAGREPGLRVIRKESLP